MPTDKRYNNYTTSILVSTLVGVAIIIPALLLHALNLGSLPSWLIDLVSAVFGISFVSRLVSGSSYAAQIIDRLAQENTLLDVIFTKLNLKKNDLKNEPQDKKQLINKIKPTAAEIRKNKYFGQFVGNTIGFISATAFAVTTLCLRAVTPTIINGFISSAFYLINHISNFSGLFNRSGRAIDFLRKDTNKEDKTTQQKKGRLRRHRVNYVLGVLLGAVVAAILIAVILSVVGITSAMSLGGAVPIWLSLGLLVIGTVSTGASAGGYIGRCFDFLLGKRTLIHAVSDIPKREQPKTTIKDRVCYENGGTVIGVGLGITLATILIVAGVASLPFFGLGLPKLFAGIILMSACVSQCGGLGNRIGQMLDKFFRKGKYQQKTENASDKMVKQSHDNHPNVSPGIPSNLIVTCPSPQPVQSQQNSVSDYQVMSQATLNAAENKIDIQKEDVDSTSMARPQTEIINPKFNEVPVNNCNAKNKAAMTYQIKKINDNLPRVSIKDLTDFSIFNKPVDHKQFVSQISASEHLETNSARYAAAAAA